MAHTSDPFFRTFHALRIKGFAKSETIAEVADLPCTIVDEHLAGLQDRQWAMFREARQLWQLTPVGRDQHGVALAEDVGVGGLRNALRLPYVSFLQLNERFKVLCGAWQLKAGEPNDHSDASYDGGVVTQLVGLNEEAIPVVASMGAVLDRLAPYGPRLANTCKRVMNGEANMFTGVLCGSYHDVWMELHEDLILSQGIDRNREGSF
ncbi:MAG: MarR family transcriptional regulator [Actinobacteria bacterium]|nr:MarR family transcriptional regulator [Actinomycetota bacterium]